MMSSGGPSSGSTTPGGGKAASSATLTIGHYVLGETLGIGTFGKVKGKKTSHVTGCM